MVRRRRGSLTASVSDAPNALVAASAPVLKAADIFKVTGGQRETWQDEAWELFDLVGELGCYIRWRARSCSRVKVVASEIDPDTGQPTGGIADDNTEGRKVAAIVASIAGGPLGQAELIERSVQILGVPGEYWNAILQTDEGERWLAVSRKQMKASQKNRDGITIVLPEGGEHEFDAAKGDGMFRVWNAHANMPTEADSPVRSNLSPLREIVRTTAKIENADKSRLANNGLLIIPTEASLPSAQAPVSANKPGGEDTAQPQSASKTLQRLIVDANEIGLRDPASQVSISPIVIGAPAEHVDKIKHVTFGKDVSEVEIKKRDAAVLRFARGIDMEPDQLLGLGDVNHWNGHLLSDQDVNMHVKPVMKTVLQAWYRNAVRPLLVKAKIDPTKYVLVVDASDLTADPDKTDEAKDANAVGALRNAALLKHLGLPEDDGYDLTSIEGLQQLALDKIAQASPSEFVAVVRAALPLLDKSVQAIDFPEPAALPVGGDRNGANHDDELVDPGDEPDTEKDASRKPVTAAFADGVAIAADSYLTRAMELAGKKRVRTGDGEQKARLRDVEPQDYYRYMPPVAAAEVGRLIAGYDSGLDGLAEKHSFDADQVRSFVAAEARRRLTAHVVQGEVG
ncbi:hypothetical protein H7K45_27780 [Mycobacterium yunnanensis]|uniref:Portal protein n=1 Tax=Mycobacterium yunnanensis TaxID=368477 RepID=A0A9X2ZBD9_9MYCO|nr:hypothetical protein [Mycobacterium yunnanensis]